MYLYAAAFSSGRIPPSPLHMAVFAMAAPLDRAVFASLDRAPKDMWETKTGVSSTMGLAAFFPMMVFVTTGSPSFSGAGSSCAPFIRISSQLGMGICVPMAAWILCPVTDISWISLI